MIKNHPVAVFVVNLYSLPNTWGGANVDEIREHCLCGASLGSLLSILRIKIDKRGLIVAVFLGSSLEVLSTFGFNLIFAMIFSPLACDLLFPRIGLEKNQNSCVALAGAIALASPWLVRNGFPILAEKVEKVLKSLNPKTILERLIRLWDDSKGSK